MTNFNANEFKIPVISGINDIPIPPNFNGNGKGNNGAYYVDRHNKLVDLFSTVYNDVASVRVENFRVNGNFDSLNLKLRENISNPLEFTFDIINPNSAFSVEADLYYGINTTENLSLAAANIQSGYTYSPLVSSYEQNTTIYWKIILNLDGIFKVESEPITIKWKSPIVAGSSILNDVTNNINSEFFLLTETLEFNSIFTFPEFPQSRYIYLFSPTKIKGLRMSDNLIQIATKEISSDISIYIGGYPIFEYYLYRSSVPTRGDFSFEIVS